VARRVDGGAVEAAKKAAKAAQGKGSRKVDTATFEASDATSAKKNEREHRKMFIKESRRATLKSNQLSRLA